MLELVGIKNNNSFADSLTIAEHFGKEHKDVLRVIDKLIIEISVNIIWERKITLRNYTDSRGKQQRKYYLDRDTFSLLVMGFNGTEALEWKMKYIEAFNKMEAIITQRSSTEWQLSRSNGKISRRTETDSIQNFIAYATEQGSTTPNMYYKHFTSLVHKTVEVKDGEREILTSCMLSTIKVVEVKVSELIDKQIEDGIPYRAIYTHVKEQLGLLQSLLPESKNKYLPFDERPKQIKG